METKQKKMWITISPIELAYLRRITGEMRGAKGFLVQQAGISRTTLYKVLKTGICEVGIKRRLDDAIQIIERYV